MVKPLPLILALTLAGCASWYVPHTTTITLAPPSGMKLETGAVPTQITTFEQWTSAWSAVCGALVQYQNGQPAQMIPGNCGTPLTLLMNAPMNAGLAAAVAAGIK